MEKKKKITEVHKMGYSSYRISERLGHIADSYTKR